MIQKGVYTINCGTDRIRLILLSEISKIKQNAFWCLISSKPKLIDWDVENYQPGLTEEQIRAYLEQIQGSKNS